MIMRRRFIWALLAVAIAAAGATAATAKPLHANGKIVFNSDNLVTGEEQVYTVDPDGGDPQLIANNAEVGGWSPDGSLVALFGDAGERLFNPDTGASRDLGLPDTHYPGLLLFCGLWSPDGARLACEGFGTDDSSLNGVYTVRSSDGGDLKRVTSEPNGDDCPSDYSPDGKQLVVTRLNESGSAGLFTVKVDGHGQRQIVPDGTAFNFCNGSWSPHGNEILFSAHAPDFDYHSSIWVVHADGDGMRELPVAGCGGPNSDPTAIGCFNPTWSPDGKEILFDRRQGRGASDLYTANADGSGLFQVTNTPEIDEGGADWGTHPVTP
jgi:Tol biopolymer transport system component